MLMFCPEYRKHFPKVRLAGGWVAEAFTHTLFSNRENIRFQKEYATNQQAYRAARWAALKVDWMVDCEEIGVSWRVYKKGVDPVALSQ